MSVAAKMPIDILLPRLGRVSETGNSCWSASCPTPAHKHGDRSRGLSIKQTEDRRVLLHCYAGCDVKGIVSALGLSLSDLFPKSGNFGKSYVLNQNCIQAAQIESWVIWILVERISNGKSLTLKEKGSFRKSVKRLEKFGGMV